MYFSAVSLRDDISLDNRSRYSRGYSIHKAMWSLFEDKKSNESNRERNFLYREHLLADQPTVYVVSEEKPHDSSVVWDIETKVYSPLINTGMRLAFALHANPTVMRRDKSGRFQKHDVVTDALYTLLQAGVPRCEIPSTYERARSSGFEWLRDRGTRAGFSVAENEVIVDRYEEQKIYKPKCSKPISMKTLDFSGALTVTDPAKFKKVLYEGIGTGRSFGCGLMLIKPL